MNNKIEVIGIDHGWSNIKTSSQVFVTGVKDITTEPALFDGVLEYKGRYYKVGGNRQEVKSTKTEDDTFYLLTLAAVAKELRRRGKIFIFVTHLKRRNNPFTHIEKNIPSVSRCRKALPYFDATAIVYRNCYYEDFNKADEDIEEIRIYERGKKKYRAVPVEFDFQHQRVKRK